MERNSNSVLLVNEFIEFLNDTRPDSSCPGCGTSPSVWSLCSSVWEGNPYGEQMGSEFMEPVFHTFKTLHPDGNPVGFSTYAMFCTNCGHLEHIMVPVVQEWVSKRNEGAEDERP